MKPAISMAVLVTASLLAGPASAATRCFEGRTAAGECVNAGLAQVMRHIAIVRVQGYQRSKKIVDADFYDGRLGCKPRVLDENLACNSWSSRSAKRNHWSVGFANIDETIAGIGKTRE